MRNVWSKVREELLAVLPPTLFFFVALHVIALIRVLMARAVGISPSSVISIGVASLILGKAVLLADMLPIINRYPDRFLFGTDVVAPKDSAQYFALFDTYAPLWAQLTPEASLKVRRGNYERLFDAGRRRVRAWEQAQGLAAK